MSTITENLPVMDEEFANLQSLVDKLNEAGDKLLDKCALLGKGVEREFASLEDTLRRGIEARKLAGELNRAKSYGAGVLAIYTRVMKLFADWKRRTDALIPLIKRAEQLVSRVDELLALINRPAPPIDEETLRRRAAQLDEQGGWLKFEDVLAELKGQG